MQCIGFRSLLQFCEELWLLPLPAVPVGGSPLWTRLLKSMVSDRIQPTSSAPSQKSPTPKSKRGRKPKPIVQFPEPLTADWIDVPAFHGALSLHAARHGDSICHLHKALESQGEAVERSTLLQWASGKKRPTSVSSLQILGRIEARYRLPDGYFRSKLLDSARAPSGHKKLRGVTPSERRRLAWHLPNDSDSRSTSEREEILAWIRAVVISGATDYRRYQAQAAKLRYSIRFPLLTHRKALRVRSAEPRGSALSDGEADSELTEAAADAPPLLADEMAELVLFKTSTLTDIGFQRNGVWNEQTAFQKIEHLGLLFGALAAPPQGAVKGLGVEHSTLAMGLLVFPAVWDWYVKWRERRRGFYTVWEVNMLQLGLALARVDTGWLRQSPALGDRL